MNALLSLDDEHMPARDGPRRFTDNRKADMPAYAMGALLGHAQVLSRLHSSHPKQSWTCLAGGKPSGTEK